MKKITIVICLFLIFILIYLLQVNFFSWFNLAGIKPNLFVIFIFVIGLFAGKSIGTVFGIFFGFILDSLIGKSIGISAIMLGSIGFLGGYLDKKFSKDSKITMMIMIMLSTLFFEIGEYTFQFFINSAQLSMLIFIRNLCIELMYNCIMVIILYPIISKFGYMIEENFKDNQILTRYF